MDNQARLDFIFDAVDALELEEDEKTALMYVLSSIPSVSIDVDGVMSFTDAAIAVCPDLSSTSQTMPIFTGG